MSSNELLNQVLELAEKNMNENEYLQVANLLKNAHKVIPDTDGIYKFPQPFQVKFKDSRGNQISLFEIYGYEKTPIVIFSVSSGSDNSIRKKLNYPEMEKFIEYKLKSVCATDVSIINGWLGNEIFVYENFNDQMDTLYTNTDRDNFEYHNEIVEKYTEIIILNLLNMTR